MCPWLRIRPKMNREHSIIKWCDNSSLTCQLLNTWTVYCRGVQETEKPNLNRKKPKNRNQKNRNRLKNRRFGFYILKKPKFLVRFGFSFKNRPIETEPTFKVKIIYLALLFINNISTLSWYLPFTLPLSMMHFKCVITLLIFYFITIYITQMCFKVKKNGYTNVTRTH